jgi:hypothetical protein
MLLMLLVRCMAAVFYAVRWVGRRGDDEVAACGA